jgi:hypothetical protein
MSRTKQLERAGGLVYVASVRYERKPRSYLDKTLSRYGGTERPNVKSTFVPRQVFIEVRSSVATNVIYVRAELETVPRQIYRGMINSSLEGFELEAEINGIVPRQNSFYLDKKRGSLSVVCCREYMFYTRTSLVGSYLDKQVLSRYGKHGGSWLRQLRGKSRSYLDKPYLDKTYGGGYNYERCPVCLGWVLRWCS